MTGICTFFRQVPWTYQNSLKQMKHLSCSIGCYLKAPSLWSPGKNLTVEQIPYSTLLPEKFLQEKPWSSMQYLTKTRKLFGPFWRVFWEKEKALGKKAQWYSVQNTYIIFFLWESLKMETFQTFNLCFVLAQGLLMPGGQDLKEQYWAKVLSSPWPGPKGRVQDKI